MFRSARLLSLAHAAPQHALQAELRLRRALLLARC